MNDLITTFEELQKSDEYEINEENVGLLLYLRQNYSSQNKIWEKITLPEEIVVSATYNGVSEEGKIEAECSLDLVSMVCFDIDIQDEDLCFDDEYVMVQHDNGIVSFKENIIYDYYREE